MGTFSTTIEIGNLSGECYVAMEALADTGASTTVVPRSILDGLGILPTRQETFEYASGERVELDMAQAWARVEGRETYTWVIFGEDGVAPILGAYTLEGVFLAVDPYNQRLIPVVGSLKQYLGDNCYPAVISTAANNTTLLGCRSSVHRNANSV